MHPPKRTNMKITTNIDSATKKRLVNEAISATESELYGAVLQNGMDPESFDSDDFKPSEPPTEKETDIQRIIDKITSLQAKLKKLG